VGQEKRGGKQRGKAIESWRGREGGYLGGARPLGLNKRRREIPKQTFGKKPGKREKEEKLC